jgi:hypothetical protein
MRDRLHHKLAFYKQLPHAIAQSFVLSLLDDRGSLFSLVKSPNTNP